MNLISKIFGSDKIIDKGMAGIDALVYTDQEKSETKLELLERYEPFKLAQRLLALLFSSIFLIVFMWAVIIWSIGAFTEDLEKAGYLMSIAFELADWNVKTLGTAVSLIVGFYFTGGLIEGAIVKFRDKSGE